MSAIVIRNTRADAVYRLQLIKDAERTIGRLLEDEAFQDWVKFLEKSPKTDELIIKIDELRIMRDTLDDEVVREETIKRKDKSQ